MTARPRLSTLLLIPALLIALVPAAASACGDWSNCFVIRVQDAADVDTVVQSHNLTFIDDVHGSIPTIFLAEGPSSVPAATTRANLSADPLVLGGEQAEVAALSEDDSNAVLDSVNLASLSSLTLAGTSSSAASSYFTSSSWSGFLDQPAANVVRVGDLHALTPAEARGVGVVAVIDTGVDPDHPLLDGALVSGFDATDNTFGIPSEFKALDPATAQTTEDNLRAAADQSYGTIVEGNGTTVLHSPGAEVIIEQSYGTIVEGENLPSGFGHGTMVAGIVRMVAPNAKIMPIRAFGGDGTGRVWDVIKGVFFATLAGADVINMSFSLEEHSPMLEHAINFAKFLGVTCVSSTGNQGTASNTYPAALGNVIGVAATDNDDILSAFSNYGMGLATVAAPGEAIVTLYPGGLYAGAWGTSFSSAFVAGAIATLHNETTFLGNTIVIPIGFSLGEVALTSSAYNPDPVNLTDWGAGRLDARAAFDFGRAGGS